MIFTKRTYHYISACCIITLAIVIQACSKYDVFKNNNLTHIELIKSDFQAKSKEYYKSNIIESKNFRQSLKRTIAWDRVHFRQDTAFIPITLHLPDSLLSDGKKTFLDNKVYLKVSPSLEGDTFNFEMLSYFPNKNSTEQYFSGTVLVEDYFIGKTKYANYFNGKPVKKYINFVNKTVQKGEKIAESMVYECEDILIGQVCVGGLNGSDTPDICSNRYERVCDWTIINSDYIPPISGTGSGSSPTSSLPTNLQNSLLSRPFGLLKDVDCSSITAWINLARAKINQSQTDKLNSIVSQRIISPGIGAPGFTHKDVARVQSINDATSSSINLDYFSTTVNTLPQGFSSLQALLHHKRTNMHQFIPTSIADFKPYTWHGVNDTYLWSQNNPLNAVVAIDLGIEYGSVIVSESSANKWQFTTIYDPQFKSHPVSGNREFEYTVNSNGSYTFYTRGADRLTGSLETLAQLVAEMTPDFISSELQPFEIGDNVWRSFQDGLINFINSNQGSASKNDPVIKRPDWFLIRDVINGTKPISVLNSNC